MPAARDRPSFSRLVITCRFDAWLRDSSKMAAGALGSVSNRLRHQNGDTHVGVFDDVFSDAGSTPAASTNLRA